MPFTLLFWDTELQMLSLKHRRHVVCKYVCVCVGGRFVDEDSTGRIFDAKTNKQINKPHRIKENVKFLQFRV